MPGATYDFFDDSCPACREEYLEMGSAGKVDSKHYKELAEERAKKL